MFHVLHNYFNPIFYPKFGWLIWCIVSQIYYFLIFHYYTIIIDIRLSIIFCLSSGDIKISLGISLSLSFLSVSKLFLVNFLKLFFFYTPLLYYFNLSSSIISCLSSEEIYLSLGISLLYSFVTVSELFCGKFFETFVILLAILLPVKSPVGFDVF